MESKHTINFKLQTFFLASTKPKQALKKTTPAKTLIGILSKPRTKKRGNFFIKLTTKNLNQLIPIEKITSHHQKGKIPNLINSLNIIRYSLSFNTKENTKMSLPIDLAIKYNIRTQTGLSNESNKIVNNMFSSTEIHKKTKLSETETNITEKKRRTNLKKEFALKYNTFRI